MYLSISMLLLILSEIFNSLFYFYRFDDIETNIVNGSNIIKSYQSIMIY